jgi:ribosome maturation factor RimP
MDVEQKVKAWVEDIIHDDERLFVVDVLVSDSGGNSKVTVYIDGDTGVSIDACARVSRKLSEKLDESELFDGKYTLEVSSPGLNHPLKLRRQYVNNIGRQVKILLINSQEKTGTLTKVEEEKVLITMLPENKKKKVQPAEEITIPFADIKKTNVMASFN